MGEFKVITDVSGDGCKEINVTAVENTLAEGEGVRVGGE